ncbi:MAG: ferredoxin family protein [Chloroflexi bacterium]|nr:ferredoxin family protein [Chloroflexota bacterium]
MDAQRWFPRVDYLRCTGSGECIRVCPSDVFVVRDNKPVVEHPARCTYCTLCEEQCPEAAIELPYLVCRPETPAIHEEPG